MTRTWISCASIALACLLALPVHAQTSRALRQQVEGTMVVTGTVDIAPDGRLAGHAIDERGQLPDYVLRLMERALPNLRFEPIEGETAPVRAKMSLRLVATTQPGGDMQVAIRSAHFGEEAAEPDTGGLAPAVRGKMTYPRTVAEIGGKGTVYLLLRIGRDGKVQEAVAEQVNLTALGNAREMAAIRNSLATAAIRDVTRGWSFTTPTTDEAAGQDFWVARLTVDYRLNDDKVVPYGQWAGYHPGERAELPAWAAPTPPGFGPDAMLANEFAPETSRFRLATAIDG